MKWEQTSAKERPKQWSTSNEEDIFQLALFQCQSSQPTKAAIVFHGYKPQPEFRLSWTCPDLLQLPKHHSSMTTFIPTPSHTPPTHLILSELRFIRLLPLGFVVSMEPSSDATTLPELLCFTRRRLHGLAYVSVAFTHMAKDTFEQFKTKIHEYSHKTHTHTHKDINTYLWSSGYNGKSLKRSAGHILRGSRRFIAYVALLGSMEKWRVSQRLIELIKSKTAWAKSLNWESERKRVERDRVMERFIRVPTLNNMRTR